MGLLREQTQFTLCAVLIIVCSAVEDKSVTIVRRFGNSDKFSFSKSINEDKLPTQCKTFSGNPLAFSQPVKDCACENKQETFGYFDNKWRCIDQDDYFARNISGSNTCKLDFDDERLAVVKGGKWSYINLWSNRNGNCKIDWKASSMLGCYNSLTPFSKIPSFDFYTHHARYLLRIKTITKEMSGRVIKITIHCEEQHQPYHCLMVKIAGEIKCPLNHFSESTTPISTTSVLSSTATTETNVTTRPTTRIAVKNKKRTGNQPNVPVVPIVAGVAAAVIIVILLIVFLILRRKYKRKNAESYTQDGQLEQAENEPRGSRYRPVYNKRHSLVVGSRDSPVYERVLNRDSNSDDQTDNDQISPTSQFSFNPEYESVRSKQPERASHEHEDKKLLSSENYDYAKVEGPPERKPNQNTWYDVPECEIGTLKSLPDQNYYDVAGSIIPGERTHLTSHPGQQDENDDVIANPLYGAF